jgi:hypothetical protein
VTGIVIERGKERGKEITIDVERPIDIETMIAVVTQIGVIVHTALAVEATTDQDER